MVKFAPFTCEDFGRLGPLAEYGAYIPDGLASALEGSNAWSLWVGDRIVACCGTIEVWKNRHAAWAYFSTTSGKYMARATRFTSRYILPAAHGRIEAIVRADFAAGNRWLKLLGFAVENPPGILTAYGPDGSDYISYVLHNQ